MDGRNCDSICALSIYAVARKNCIIDHSSQSSGIDIYMSYSEQSFRLADIAYIKNFNVRNTIV